MPKEDKLDVQDNQGMKKQERETFVLSTSIPLGMT